MVFDLQGNCKSGLVTLFSRSREKVGFGRKSVREWPNILATNSRFEISSAFNIRLQYVGLIQQFFQDQSDVKPDGVRFRIRPEEKSIIQKLLDGPELKRKMRVMVCPGSKWVNKQLPMETLFSFISKIEQSMNSSFLLVSGSDEERNYCHSLHQRLSSCSSIVDRLDLPLWQNLMNEMDLVIAVDSSALHLCATTSTPSFSVFGPTSPEIFKPIGANHFAFQGACPTCQVFEKQCPFLRSCKAGDCIRQINPDELFHHFWNWWNSSRKPGLENNSPSDQ